MKPLTERDYETLGDLIAATDNFLRYDQNDGWVMPLDCGGSNGSHHSYTLHKLAKRGLCLRKKFGGPHEKGSCRYKANQKGRDHYDIHRMVRKNLTALSSHKDPA